MTHRSHPTLLMTGAAGGLGQAMRARLKANCQTLRLSDVQPMAPAQPGEEVVQALPGLALNITDWVNRTFHTSIDPVELLSNLNLTAQQITDIASQLAGGILVVFTSVVGLIFDLVTVIVFSFYFSADSPRIKRWIAGRLKPSRQVVFINVWDISVQKAGGFVISKLALATLSSVFHCLFFWIIDIPYWLPMGIFAGVVSQFIPTIGTYIGVALPAQIGRASCRERV